MNLFDQKKHMLVLFCSPNPHGSTRRLLDSFMEEFKDRVDWRTAEVNAYELNAHPCTGCRACAKKEKCTYDDLDKFDKELRKCDLLVVASPVYNDSFTSPMKAILDRTQRYFEARFSLAPPAHKEAQGRGAALDHGPGGGLPLRGYCPPAPAGLQRHEHHFDRLRRLGRHGPGPQEPGPGPAKSPGAGS